MGAGPAGRGGNEKEWLAAGGGMEFLWGDRSGMEGIFFLCALAGGGLFLAHLVHCAAAGSGPNDAGFFGMPVLTAFFTIFGVAGLALSRRRGVAVPDAVVPAAFAGLAVLWPIRRIFRAAAWLEPIGEPEAGFFVGRSGYACRTIPEDGTGTVLMPANGRQWEFEALSLEGDAIETGEPVRAVYAAGMRLIVRKADAP